MTLKGIVLLAILLLAVNAKDSYHNPPTGKYRPKCCEYNTVRVYGSASIQAQPDQAILQASITVNGATVAQAISNLAKAVNNIISVLTNNSLTSDDYYSTGFYVYPNTSYENGTSTVLGQIAYEGFQITIPSITNNGANIGQLIDSLATAVNGIVINGLTFGIFNKTQIYQLARQEAFLNARQKAADYTEAFNVALGCLVSIIDSQSIAPVVTPAKNFNQNQDRKLATPTQIKVAPITINYNVQVTFTFK